MHMLNSSLRKKRRDSSAYSRCSAEIQSGPGDLFSYCRLQRWACSLSPNHQFSQRFWYVVYDIALCMHTWREIRNLTRQKFRLAPDEESKICEKLDPEPESLFNFCSSGSLCGCFLQWCKRLQGCSHTPKVLICRKYWNRRKFGQNPWKSWQNPSKSGQHGTALFDFNICRKTNDLFWRSHQKRSSWSLLEEIHS